MPFNFQLYDKFGAVIVIYKGANPEIILTFVVKKGQSCPCAEFGACNEDIWRVKV
jgi:hypothetical protein